MRKLFLVWLALGLVVVGPSLSQQAQAEPTPAAEAPPAGFVAMEVVAVVRLDLGDTVILANAGRDVLIPISVGPSEALAINLRHEGRRFPRPLTHDLLDEVFKLFGASVEHVQVVALRDGTFIAAVQVRDAQGRRMHVDARASDSIAVALGHGVPIYVADQVVSEAGLRADDPVPARPPRRDLPDAL